jgi:tetratricopeptide (TPR) repeat protein
MDPTQPPDPSAPAGDQFALRDIINSTVAIGAGATARTEHHHHYAPPTPIDLAAAQAQLDALPFDVVPPVTTLPSGSRMPLRRNFLFVGRENDLRRLAQTLKGGQAAAVTTGIGGIGKTQLASEFAHCYGHHFVGGVFWLSFASADTVPSEIAACGGPAALNIPGFAALALDDQVARVCQVWQDALPRLLIFDNCEDETLFDQWRPKSGGCRVLLTSRRSHWSKALGIAALPLGVLPRAESVALLHQHRPDINHADANAIAEELGDLPLALHLAGSYLETFVDSENFGDPQAFLAELRDARLLQHPALEGENTTPSPTNHALHVGKTFALSIERLDATDATDALALALLARAAYLAPGEPIPRALLLATLKLPKDDRAAARDAERALLRLTALGLLEPTEDGALRLHRLLAVFVGQTVEDATAQPAVVQAVFVAAAQVNRNGYPLLMAPLQIHLRQLAEQALDLEDESIVSLLNEHGYYLRSIGDYAGARTYYERALQIREQVLGAQHPDTAGSLNNLGALLDSQGDYAGARPYFEQSLQIREQVQGAQHPDTATSLNNLGYLLQAQGDYAGARPYFEQSLQIREQVQGAQHPDTATSLNNLAILCYYEHRFADAVTLMERALQIREQVLGLEHPNTQESRASLEVIRAAAEPGAVPAP